MTRLTQAAGRVVSQGAIMAPMTAPTIVSGRIYFRDAARQVVGPCPCCAYQPTDDSENNKSKDTKNNLGSHVGLTFLFS